MDNVFQHSEARSGFAMMQVHPRRKWLAVAVSDSGIGVHRSFLKGGVHPANDAYEALMLAVQERVTSKEKNMGNGLYGLMRTVGLGAGKLEIRSGRGVLAFKGGQITGDASRFRPLLETSDHHGTSVDWQLDILRFVNLQEVFPGSRHTSLRLEALENEQGQHQVLVRDFEEDLGTRRSAEHVRNRLLNLIGERARRIKLDFEGVNVVSSSSADEVLGKLALELGILRFMRTFDLANMSKTVETIVERAIQRRLEEGDAANPGSGPGWRPVT